VFEPDAAGRWLAHVVEVPGCHTHGRTLDQARRRLREALSLWVDAGEAELVEEIRLPSRARESLQRSRAARLRAEQERTTAANAVREAARTLVDELHLGLRDTGELLGLSHQRVQQLVRESGAQG
jgi:predicted RNase H-like HicB family nuclease